MVHWCRLVVMFLLVIFACPVMAQQNLDLDETEIDCEQAYTTVELRTCFSDSYDEADKDLNDVYKKLIASHEKALQEAKKEGREDLAYFQARLDSLRQAQRDWIKFRDSWCEYVTDPDAGGSIRPLIGLACVTDLTQQQTSKLRDILEIHE